MADTAGPSRREHRLLRPRAARGRHSGRAGRGARCARSGEGRRRRHARGFLLDAARGVREAPRAFDPVRSGVPHLLSQARLPRQADGDDAAAGAASTPQAPQAGAQRVQEALFSGLDDKLERKKPEVEVDARLTVSDREVLQKKDFAQMTAAEIAAAKEAIKRLVLSLDEVKTRRLAPHRTAISSTCAARCARASRPAARSSISNISGRDQGAADRGAARYFRLDEPVHAAVPAFPPRA